MYHSSYGTYLIAVYSSRALPRALLCRTLAYVDQLVMKSSITLCHYPQQNNVNKSKQSWSKIGLQAKYNVGMHYATQKIHATIIDIPLYGPSPLEMNLAELRNAVKDRDLWRKLKMTIANALLADSAR